MTPLSVALALAGTASAAPPAPPNVVIIDVCSARADHFHTYGYFRETTPKVDEFAKDAVVFENAEAQGSWCLPNFAALFTGQRPEVNGMYTDSHPRKLPKTSVTLAQKLQKAGYRTAAFSGGIFLSTPMGLDPGFELYVNPVRAHTPFGHVPSKGNVKDALGWIDKNKTKPFFAYLAIDDLHAPYFADDPDKYDPGYTGIATDTDTLTVKFMRAYDGLTDGYPKELLPKALAFKADPRALPHLVARYDAALNTVDGEIGAVLDGLKKKRLYGRTIVIVTADHGEMLGENGLLGHQMSLYEGVTHVPLIVRVPELKADAGKRYKQLIERVDLMPTVLDAVGVSTRDLEMQGRSFLPMLKNPDVGWPPYAFSSSKPDASSPNDLRIQERAVRTDRWKLHHNLYDDHFQLYDLSVDPLEEHDVSRQHPDVVNELAFELIKQMENERPHAPGLPSGRNDLPTGELRAAPLKE